MADGDRLYRSPYATARTAPARTGGAQDPIATSHAGLVLLYSPNFRAMTPAYPFDRPELIIGRDASCAVVLDDQAVSRRHARIANVSGRWSLVDLDSRNGVFIDGERLRGEAELEAMQEVRIGDALFKFVESEAEQYARYRLDGAIDGVMPPNPPAFVGGFSVRRLDAELLRIAPTDLSCVILGETGTGKEVFACELHRISGRPGAFCPVHCGAIPHGLLESELFGFRRGAFSGAHRDRIGLIQQAHRGTLFLDEIGDMPLEAQVKLLRVLQTHEVLAIGATQPDRVDLRIACATNRDLYRMVQEGTFRGDLFARLNEHQSVLPPLRERKEDIYALTHAFLARGGKRLQPSFAFMMALLQYDWPFNVRELESAVKRAAALAEAGVLEPKHLPTAVLEAGAASAAAMPNVATGRASLPGVAGVPSVPGPLSAGSNPVSSRSPRYQATPPTSAAEDTGAQAAHPSRGAPGATPDRVSVQPGFFPGAPTEDKMRELLSRHAGNVAAIARELGKGRMQIHRWVRRYGLSIEDYRGRR